MSRFVAYCILVVIWMCLTIASPILGAILIMPLAIGLFYDIFNN